MLTLPRQRERELFVDDEICGCAADCAADEWRAECARQSIGIGGTREPFALAW